jgi:hypothetical protein
LQAYPQAAKVQDKYGRLPLHWALRCKASPDVVTMLLQAYPQVVEVQEKVYGCLPLHYALWINASPDVINMIFKAYPKAAAVQDKQGKTPIAYAQEPNNVLHYYLEQKPETDYSFYCFLQGLRDDVRNEAVRNIYVQDAVRNNLAQWLPTFALMLDFYWILIVIACFGTAVSWYSDYLMGDPHPPYPMTCQTQYDHCIQTSNCNQYYKCIHPQLNSLLWVTIAGGHYFFIREFLQILSFVSIGYFKGYRKDPTNYIDVICIAIMLIWPILMLTEAVNRESSNAAKEIFRSLSSFSAGFLFPLVFSFLKRVLISFAVFVRGL